MEKLAIQHGVFLPRGIGLDALDRHRNGRSCRARGTARRLRAGGVLGTVQEGLFTHKIMVPFDQPGEVEVTWIQEGSVTVDTPVARIRDHAGARALARPDAALAGAPRR